MPHHQNEITQLLAELSAGNRAVVSALIPLVYDELRAIAHRQLLGERPGHTLNTTALVHEAYLKLIKQDEVNLKNRVHFFSIASMAMRRILVDYARSRRAQKRGGGHPAATFDVALSPQELRAEELVALDEALSHLEHINERQSQVVTYRFFGGLTQKEIAEVLGVSETTVRREWRLARAWLFHQLTPNSEQE